MRFLPIVTQIFLWGAVFAGMSAAAGQAASQGIDTKQIAGYGYHDFVAYYLLTMVGRAFSSMPGLASGIAVQIRNGEIKKYLIQPVDLLGFLLLMRVAHKLVYYVIAAAPFALVFFLCRGYFPGWPPAAGAFRLRHIADVVVLAGLFSGSDDRHDRLLVSGGQLAAVRLHAVQFLLLRPHVSARHAAAAVEHRGDGHAAAILGLLSGGRVPAKDRGSGTVAGLGDPSGMGVVLHHRLPRDVRAGYQAIQRIRRVASHVPAPSYFRVFLTFARNSLVRDMMFPANFIIESISSIRWVLMNLGFYLLIFQYTSQIGGGGTAGSAWDKYQFFVFLATTMFVNSIVQTFFMPNAEEFSELIRTGGLDFALLKPIDTQFLISLRKIEWASLANFIVAAVLMGYALPRVEGFTLSVWQVLLYPLYVLSGVGILYSLMIVLAAASIWLGRNQSLYDFWFYITNFSRYPMEIYDGPVGGRCGVVCTFVIPVLVVVNVPARMLAKPLQAEYWYLAIFALFATAVCLVVSRWVFQRALLSYRSASS